MRSRCSGLALSPARIAAGSPGVSRSRQKHEQRHHAHHRNGGKHAAEEVNLASRVVPGERRDPYTLASRVGARWVRPSVTTKVGGYGSRRSPGRRSCKNPSLHYFRRSLPRRKVSNWRATASLSLQRRQQSSHHLPRSAKLRLRYAHSGCGHRRRARRDRPASEFPSRRVMQLASGKPPPALPWGRSTPICFATPRAFSL